MTTRDTLLDSSLSISIFLWLKDTLSLWVWRYMITTLWCLGAVWCGCMISCIDLSLCLSPSLKCSALNVQCSALSTHRPTLSSSNYNVFVPACRLFLPPPFLPSVSRQQTGYSRISRAIPPSVRYKTVCRLHLSFFPLRESLMAWCTIFEKIT